MDVLEQLCKVKANTSMLWPADLARTTMAEMIFVVGQELQCEGVPVQISGHSCPRLHVCSKGSNYSGMIRIMLKEFIPHSIR